MNNLSSYWGFVDAKIRASDKDLPVLHNSIRKCDEVISQVSVPIFAVGFRKVAALRAPPEAFVYTMLRGVS